MDVATLGIKVDATQVAAGTTALDKFAAAAKPAQASTSALQKAIKDASAGVVIFDGNISGTTENVARYKKAVADAAAATSPLDAATRSVGKSTTALDTAAVRASTSTKAIAITGGLARHEMINLSRQIQDVGVSLASSQSLWTVAIQQGTQIADIYGSSKTGTVGGSLQQIKSGLASVLTPMRLLAGGTALAGAAAYVAYGQWKSFALALDDTAKQAGVTTGEMAKLQAAASFKGITGEDFTKGITNFSQQVYLSKTNAGGLLEVFRANGVAARDFTGSLEKAADLIQNASSDQQRLVLLQQMGLPANMQWVRLMSQGADGIRRAKAEAVEFGGAANDKMVEKARQFDEGWNKAWTNFGLYARAAVTTAATGIGRLLADVNRGLATGGSLGSLLKIYGTSTPTDFSDFYEATNAAGDAKPKRKTTDPAALQRQLSLEQQRIGILGQTASVLDQVRAVEIQIQQARLNGVNISKAQAETLKKNAEEQALGTSAIKAATDAQRIEAEVVGMSIGQATTYAAAQNAINDAKRAGRPLTEDNIAAIRAEATALGEAAQRAEQMRWGYESLVRGPMQTFQQQLAQGATFFDALRASGISALNAISSKLMDMAAQNLWKSAFGGGGGLLSSIFGGDGGGAMSFGGDLGAGTGGMAFPTFHTGFGPGDAIKNTRYVHPAHFNDAPRFHSGIGPGERAAIIRTDESVLTPGQMKALGNGVGGGAQPVNITNHYVFNGVEPGMEARMRAYIDQGDQRSVSQAVQATQKTAANTPAFRGSFR